MSEHDAQVGHRRAAWAEKGVFEMGGLPESSWSHLRVLYESSKMPHRPVQDREEQDRQGSEGDIVGCSTDAIHQSLAREAIVELEEEEQEGKGNVLEEGVLDQAGQAVH